MYKYIYSNRVNRKWLCRYEILLFKSNAIWRSILWDDREIYVCACARGGEEENVSNFKHRCVTRITNTVPQVVYTFAKNRKFLCPFTRFLHSNRTPENSGLYKIPFMTVFLYKVSLFYAFQTYNGWVKRVCANSVFIRIFFFVYTDTESLSQTRISPLR